MVSFQRYSCNQWSTQSYAYAPLTPAANLLMTFKLHRPIAHRRSGSQPSKDSSVFYLSDVPCCFSPGMLLFACVSACIRCWGFSCLSILSGHCSRWLTRDNHVYFRGWCLGRFMLGSPLFEWSRLLGVLFVPIRFDIPSKHIWSRRRFLNVYFT